MGCLYLFTPSDRFPVPVRSAVKSNLTAWCPQWFGGGSPTARRSCWSVTKPIISVYFDYRYIKKTKYWGGGLPVGVSTAGLRDLDYIPHGVYCVFFVVFHISQPCCPPRFDVHVCFRLWTITSNSSCSIWITLCLMASACGPTCCKLWIWILNEASRSRRTSFRCCPWWVAWAQVVACACRQTRLASSTELDVHSVLHCRPSHGHRQHAQ